MKVFLSWSGSSSHKVALVLKDWIPSVIQSMEPYVSSEDIDKGTRWSTDIAKELEASGFGLLCVTKDNVNAPWLNFEAGAIGKSIDKSRVCPFLFGIKRSEVEGPILQFQSTIYEEEDVLKLIKSINKACAENGIEESRLEKSFKVWWPNLKNELDIILDQPDAGEHPATSLKPKESKQGHVEKVLEEILELSRMNQKLLRNPEEILPIGYLRHALERFSGEQEPFFDHPAFDELVDAYFSIRNEITQKKDANIESLQLEEVESWLRRFAQPIEWIDGHRRGRSRRIRRTSPIRIPDKNKE